MKGNILSALWGPGGIRLLAGDLISEATERHHHPELREGGEFAGEERPAGVTFDRGGFVRRRRALDR